MRNEIIRRARVVDTFAKRDLQMPESRSMGKDMERYSLDLGFGLELRRRRRESFDRKNSIV